MSTIIINKNVKCLYAQFKCFNKFDIYDFGYLCFLKNIRGGIKIENRENLGQCPN